jgi:DNA-directed RNA polymerase
MKPEVISLIAMKTMLDGICRKHPLTNTAIRVATNIEDEARYIRMKEEYPDVFKFAKKDVEKWSDRTYRRIREAFLRHEQGEAKKGNIEPWKVWTRKEKILMGTWLLELIRTVTNLVTFVMLGHKNKTRWVITASDDLFQWIADYNQSQELLQPLWLPMVETPAHWKGLWQGGYKDVDLQPLTFIKSNDMEYMRELDTSNFQPVIDSVNHVQDTPWTVNDKVLKIARWAWDNDREIGEMCRRTDYELPPFDPTAEGDSERKRELGRKSGVLRSLNISLRSQRLQIIKTLWLGDKYAGKHFYFPHQIDFRGRMYPVPYYLSPQGTDLAKSLLLFSESETIWNPETDARWLAIHGANCYGMDKVTFDERVKWVNDRRQEIFEVCKDPKVNDWWTGADEPWQFLAFCFEWGELLSMGGRGFKTRLPVAMDASNNGIQLLSLLGRDEIGGRATNVSATEAPADLYQFVADQVTEELKKKAKKGDHIATEWLKLGITRKLTKRPVMVKPYGGTRQSCRDYVHEWFRDLCLERDIDPFGGETTPAVSQLSMVVWKAMDECLSRPNAVMAWLQQCARLLAREGKAIEWTTPLGFKVRQKYFNTKGSQIETMLGDRISFVRWHQPLNELNRKRQANGISPNYVHSLDATIAHKTTNEAKKMGIRSLAMVHDSFATHSTNSEALSGIIRRETANTFNEDLLLKFKDEVQTQTKEELPDLPPYGTLDPLEVLGSDYFFA